MLIRLLQIIFFFTITQCQPFLYDGGFRIEGFLTSTIELCHARCDLDHNYCLYRRQTGQRVLGDC